MDLSFRPREKIQQHQKSITVGLDHGTTFTSGVYKCISSSRDSSQGEYIIDSFQRYTKGGRKKKNYANSEIPSCVRYQNDQITIGFEAMNDEENSIDGDGSTMVSGMKLGIDEQAEFQLERERLENSLPEGKNSKDVLTDYFTELFRSWKRELCDLGFAENIILNLNCAVPAAWKSPRPLHKMSNAILAAAAEANLKINPAIIFCTEPEAATAYMAENGYLKRNLKEGFVFTVCDAGGGTCDVVTYKVITIEPLKLAEVVAAKGALCGSECLDKAFRNQIEKRIASWKESQSKNDMTIIERTISSIMKTFNMDTKQHWDGKEYPYKFLIPHLRKDKSNLFEDNFLLVNRKHLNDVFEPVLNGLWTLLREQIRTAHERKDPVQAVLLVGGFSGSPYLQSFLDGRLASESARLAQEKIELNVCQMNDYAIAAGAICCAEGRNLRISRRNRCSIGLLLHEEFDACKEGHKTTEPEQDPITGEWMVNNCIKFLMKKDQEQANPEPQILYRDVDVNEDVVTILVPLYSSDSNVEDSYPIDHEKNRDIQEWEPIKFSVNIKKFKHKLLVSGENQTSTGLSGNPKSHEETCNFTQDESGRMQLRRNRQQTAKALATTRKQTFAKHESHDMQQQAEDGGSNSLTGSMNASPSGDSSSVVDKSKGTWCRVKFVFNMQIVGLLGHYTLECPAAPEKIRTKVGEVNLSWMHPPSVC